MDIQNLDWSLDPDLTILKLYQGIRDARRIRLNKRSTKSDIKESG